MVTLNSRFSYIHIYNQNIMANLDNLIFGKKKFSDILSEIYDNQKKKEQQISGLIAELKPRSEEHTSETPVTL